MSSQQLRPTRDANKSGTGLARERAVVQSDRIRRLNTKIGQAINALVDVRNTLYPGHPRYDGSDRIPDHTIRESQLAAKIQRQLDQLTAIDSCIARLRGAKRSFARGHWTEGANRLKLAGEQYPILWFNWESRAGDDPVQVESRQLYMATRATADNIALITDLVDALGIDLEQGASP